MWVDSNHDGISQPDELSGLWARGIEGIDLAYEKGTVNDAFGNELRYGSRLRHQNGGSGMAWNVFFTKH